MHFETKQVGGLCVLYVMAVDAEFGPHLRTRIKPLLTGVGPVEAAIVLTETLSGLRSEGETPDLVISLGSAGSSTLKQTEVYQASSVSYRDMDASALGFEKGRTPFLDLPAEISLPRHIPGLPTARLSTGANVVSGPAYDGIAADMVDMESFAHLRACQRFDIELIALRGISDGTDTLEHINDWTQYLHIIDEKLTSAVDVLETAINTDKLA